MRHVINHASTCLMSRGIRCLHDCILANRIDLGSALARKVSIPRVIAIECPAHAGRHICNSRKMQWATKANFFKVGSVQEKHNIDACVIEQFQLVDPDNI